MGKATRLEKKYQVHLNQRKLSCDSYHVPQIKPEF
jgi:hypothetical protein